jgi:hypothetical protein
MSPVMASDVARLGRRIGHRFLEIQPAIVIAVQRLGQV